MEISYFVKTQKRGLVALTDDEAKTIIRGEVPDDVAARLGRIGVVFTRVTQSYTLVFRRYGTKVERIVYARIAWGGKARIPMERV